MLVEKIENLINEFIKINSFNNVYNEISLQIELGIFLRKRLKNYNIEFERNVNMFFNKEFNDKRFSKSEIDIVIYDNNLKEKCAIELKYPRKKAYYKRMGLFLQDIDFINELKKQLKFQGGFVLTFVDKDTEQGFYKGKYKENTRQAIFRSNGNILYKDKYSIYWKDCKDNLKYYLLRV